MARENEDLRGDLMSDASPVHSEDTRTRSMGRKPTLSPAEQILVSKQQSTHAFPTTGGDGFLPVNPYLLSADTTGINRCMTSLSLTRTIPEESADVELDSEPLSHARLIASKSAIDLVGHGDEDVFDANSPPSTALNQEGVGGLNFEDRKAAPLENGLSFRITQLPSRSIIVSNLSLLLNDDNVQMLFQMMGDVQSVKTEYRLQGIVQVSYYDIRSAVAAKDQLNGLFITDQYLSVQFVTTPGTVGSFTEGTLLVFNIDPQLDANQVAMHFSIYGEVKRVQDIPEKEHHRLVEFYDLRHANVALEALNKADSPLSKPPAFSPTGLKQTTSVQQLMGMESEGMEDEASKSWDGSAEATRQIDAVFRQNPPTPKQYTADRTGMTKSVSIGSLGDLRAQSEMGQETPTTGVNRAVPLTPELAEGLKISDSASSLGSIVFTSQGGTAVSMGSYSPLSSMQSRGLANSASVDAGLDTYGHPTLTPPVLEGALPAFSAQQHTSPLPQALAVGGMQGRVNSGQSLLQSRQQMDPSRMLHTPASGNILQTLAAAQAAGLNVYEILARLQNSPLSPTSQLMAASRMGLGQTPLSATQLQDLTSAAGAARLTPLQNLQSSGNISSPTYGINTSVSGTGMEFSNMSKSRSSPALHATTGDGSDILPSRFGGRLSRRNVDPLIEAERRAQQQRLYALDLDKIRRKEDKRTTLMIKNIPNKYTQKMLLASIDETLRGTYDFFYLPIDFKNKCNVGYGFINMRNPEDIIPLVERFHNKKWERFNSEKICCVAYGRIQGKQALVNHFQNSSLMHEDKKHRPVLFVTDGPNKGEPEPFPVGSNIRPKITLKDRDFRSRERSGHWA